MVTSTSNGWFWAKLPSFQVCCCSTGQLTPGYRSMGIYSSYIPNTLERTGIGWVWARPESYRRPTSYDPVRDLATTGPPPIGVCRRADFTPGPPSANCAWGQTCLHLFDGQRSLKLSAISCHGRVPSGRLYSLPSISKLWLGSNLSPTSM